MLTKRPAKPSDGKKKAAIPEKATRSGASRLETAKGHVSKRRPADARPREGEDLYSSLFLKNHAVMLIIDPQNGRIVDANKAALQFYGYPPGKLKTLRISDINMLEYGDVRLKMQKALEGEERYFLFRHRLADGTIRDVEVNSGPIIVKDRELLYSIVHDVTVRNRAEQALRDSEKRYRLLVDNAEFAVVVTSLATGRVLFINERASLLFDFPASSIGERQARDHWVRAEDRDRFVADLTANGRVTGYECALKTAKGDMRWVLISANIIDFGGEQAAFIVYNDITGRKKAEDALLESEARYRRLFEDAVLGIFQTTPEGKILTINPAFARMFGYDSVDALMLNVKNVAADLYAYPSLRPNVVKMILDSNGPVQVENQYRRKDGSVFTAMLHAWVLKDQKEGIVRLEGFIEDVTSRKRAEEALRDSLETASAMFNAATESFALIDSAGIVLAANETFARRLRVSLDGIIGTSVYGYLNEDLAKHRREQLREVIQRGHPLRFSDERAGRWFEHSIYPIFDSRGKVNRLVIYSQDITDRRRSEEALRQSEALMKSIFQAAPIGIGLVYNRVLGWTNDQVSGMVGYRSEELAGKSARILYGSDEEFERVGLEKYIEVRQGGTGVVETQWKHRDGAMLDILLSSKAIDPSDSSAGVVFTALDITDRKRTEEALKHYQDELEQRVRERTTELMVANQALILEIEDRNRAERALRDSERRLSDIIEFLPDATFAIDRDGKVIAWNKSMETMTGIPAAVMLGKGNYAYAVPFYGERRPLLIDLVLSPDEEMAVRYARVQRRGDVLVGENYISKPGDGREKLYIAGTAAPLFDSQGNLVGAIESVRDITESKRAEEELRYRDAILEVASFAAERFLKAPSWETDIREILARLGTVTGVSRVYIYENRMSEEGVLLTSQSYEWVSEGIKPEIGNAYLQNLALENEGFERWADIMRQGGHLYGLVRELPASERALLQSQDILSVAAVPIFLGDRWWGFMGYDDCISERNWSDVEMEALSVVASTLSAAISRKHTEKRLVQTSERLSVVLESLPIVTFTAKGDEQGEITYITGTVEEITGFQPEAFLKDPSFFFEHVHPDDRTGVRSCHLGIASKGMCGCEFRFRAANGTYRWFSEFCRLIHGPGGSVGRIVGMWQDVTEEKRILQESSTRLQQVIQAHKLASLGEIVAGVVHEINNPNSFIAYNIPLLEEIWKLCEPVVADYAAANPGWGKRDVSIEELRNDMTEIINAFRIGSDRINRVVSNLKDFARVEEGVQAKPVSVNDVIEKTLMIVGGQIRRSVSKLDLDLGGDVPQVQGQFQKLEQVTANLLVNAHQAIPDKEKGWIRISTRYLQHLGSVVIAIEDNGVGMNRPVLDRLFEPFFTTRRDTGGTGLGLSVSYGLIQEHQGAIGVLSRPGIGSRFTVFIPVKPGVQLNLRPLILPLERDLDRLDELQTEVSGIDDGFVHWFYHYDPSVKRLADYLYQHPEVDTILMTEPPPGLDAGTLLRAIRERFPLLTTIAWGDMEKKFIGTGGEKPDIFVKGLQDIRKLKGVIDGLARQRF